MRSYLLKSADGRMTFKVEESRPEESPGALARQLAEDLQLAMDSEEDARNYTEQARFEIQKTKPLKEAIHLAKEFKRRPPTVRRRMEPAETYDLKMLEEQLALAYKRSKMFNERAAEYHEQAKKARARANELQRRLREVQS